jgi:hypothetical protein
MRNKIIACFFLTLFLTSAIGQDRRDDKRKRIDALKIAYITEKLELTPEESQFFWPIYNEYVKESRTIKKSHHKTLEGLNNEEEAKARLDNMLEMEKEHVELKRKYIDKLSGQLTYERIYNLFAIERDFKRNVINEMSSRSKRKNKNSDN